MEEIYLGVTIKSRHHKTTPTRQIYRQTKSENVQTWEYIYM